MIRFFPRCPICKSIANYTVSPSKYIVQCGACKSKFMSHDFKDPRKGLTSLSLFSAPTEPIDESRIVSLKALINQTHPIGFWLNIENAKYLPNCPLCHSQTFNVESTAYGATILNCAKCFATYRLTVTGDKAEITILELGSDPLKTGLRLDHLQTITSPEIWREIERQKIENARYCPKCNVPMLRAPITFRIGPPTSELTKTLTLITLGFAGLGIEDHSTLDFLTFEVCACPQCRQVQLSLPQKGEKEISKQNSTGQFPANG